MKSLVKKKSLNYLIDIKSKKVLELPDDIYPFFFYFSANELLIGTKKDILFLNMQSINISRKIKTHISFPVKFGKETAGISSIALSSDKRLLAAGGRGGGLEVVNLETGSVLWKKDFFEPPLFATLIGRRKLITSTRSRIYLWDSRRKVISEREPVDVFTAHSGGKYVACGNLSGEVKVIELEKFKIQKINLFSPVIFVKFDTAKNVLHIASKGELKTVDISTWKETNSFKGNWIRIYDVFSHQKGITIIGIGEGEERTYLWKFPEGEHSLVSEEKFVNFSSNSDSSVFVFGKEKDVFICRRRSRRLLKVFHHIRPIASLAINPEGKILAIGDTEGELILWDINRKVPVAVFSLHSDCINSLSFSKDLLISISDDGTVKIWDLKQRKTVLSFCHENEHF